MPGVGVTLQGLADVVSLLGAKAQQAAEGAVDGINHTALDIQRDAKRNAPVDTGRLRNSIAVDPATTSNPEARVEATVHYAPHLEYGTVKQPAQPYMTPALEANLPKHSENVAEAIKRRMGA